MGLTAYQRFAYGLFGATLKEQIEKNPHLKTSLEKAHIRLRPEVYLSYAYLNMMVVFAVGMVPVVVLGVLSGLGAVDLPATTFVFLIPLPFVLAAMVYIVTFILPDLKAGNRARDIDAKLPYALNYIATMANAGMPPAEIFEGLSRQPIYGEVAKEAGLIVRDIELFGKDIVTALNAAVDRSPSVNFQDFLQGAVAALTSGGDLKSYFLSKAEQFMYENRQEQKRFLEGLGVLAESFVTVVVAAPLFLLVLFTITTAFGSGAQNSLTMGYVLILVMLPLAQVGFAVTIKASSPEV